MTTIVLATGGFDPIHSGHIKLLEEAKQLGDQLVVGVNSDKWLERKKRRSFMPWPERSNIVGALKVVDRVIGFNDNDNSASDAIQQCLDMPGVTKVIFVNGGDRTETNIPEMDRFTGRDNVVFAFGVGGENKANSSSWILEEWKAPKTKRQWGYYRVLHEVPGCKVKELTVDPGESLSMQRHAKRNEYWLVSEGRCVVNSTKSSNILEKHDEFTIICGEWHQLTNPYDEPCRVVEIQYGEYCEEEDIERQ
jgi:cytidyltransferase-like protein